jgi:ribokinase
MRFDVVTFGSAVVDVFLDACSSQTGKDLKFRVGLKQSVDEIRFTTGGGGTNTAASFSNLGLKTGFAGKIGDGMNAGIILRELKKDGVHFVGSQGKEHTGYSVVLGCKDGGRVILTHKGVNNHLKFSDLNLKNVKSKWFYFSSLMGESFETQKRIVKWARKNKVKVAFNPSEYQCKMKGKLKEVLENTDVIILNEQEARILVPKGDIFQGLGKLGPKIICVTKGKQGNIVSDGINIYESKGHKNIICRERTGAGDAFASGFVAALIKNKDIEEAIQWGSANAESVIQKPGAKNGLLNTREISKLIKSKPVKIQKRKVK